MITSLFLTIIDCKLTRNLLYIMKNKLISQYDRSSRLLSAFSHKILIYSRPVENKKFMYLERVTVECKWLLMLLSYSTADGFDLLDNSVLFVKFLTFVFTYFYFSLRFAHFYTNSNKEKIISYAKTNKILIEVMKLNRHHKNVDNIVDNTALFDILCKYFFSCVSNKLERNPPHETI